MDASVSADASTSFGWCVPSLAAPCTLGGTSLVPSPPCPRLAAGSARRPWTAQRTAWRCRSRSRGCVSLGETTHVRTPLAARAGDLVAPTAHPPTPRPDSPGGGLCGGSGEGPSLLAAPVSPAPFGGMQGSCGAAAAIHPGLARAWAQTQAQVHPGFGVEQWPAQRHAAPLQHFGRGSEYMGINSLLSQLHSERVHAGAPRPPGPGTFFVLPAAPLPQPPCAAGGRLRRSSQRVERGGGGRG